MIEEVNYTDILKFWFQELKPSQWFTRSEEVDEMIRARFGASHERAVRGELFTWRKSAAGRLAEILVLDQFSRNIHRETPEAFASDPMALVLAQEMVLGRLDLVLPVEQRAFAYMPYMHSESLFIHTEALALFSTPGMEENLKYEILHKEIIQRFGRYPHRNQVLARESSPEEIAFLKTHAGF